MLGHALGMTTRATAAEAQTPVLLGSGPSPWATVGRATLWAVQPPCDRRDLGELGGLDPGPLALLRSTSDSWPGRPAGLAAGTGALVTWFLPA